MFFLVLLLFLWGSVLASFFMAWVDRSLIGESIIRPPSHCNACNQRLDFLSLIPIWGFLWFRGRCSHCKQKVPRIYPIGELWLGLYFVFCFFMTHPGMDFFLFIFVGTILFTAAYMDLKTLEIYNIFSYAIFAGGLVRPFYERTYGALLWASVFAGMTFLIFFAISKYYKGGGGFGQGDVLLLSALCFFFSFPQGLYFMTAGFVSGAILGGILLLFKKANLASKLPFVPFLWIGLWIFIFWMQQFPNVFL